MHVCWKQSACDVLPVLTQNKQQLPPHLEDEQISNVISRAYSLSRRSISRRTVTAPIAAALTSILRNVLNTVKTRTSPSETTEAALAPIIPGVVMSLVQ